MPVLDSLGCEWLLLLAIFMLVMISLTLQFVSGYCPLQYFKLFHIACSWLFRM